MVRIRIKPKISMQLSEYYFSWKAVQKLSVAAFTFYFLMIPPSCSPTPKENKPLSTRENYRSIAVAKYQSNIEYLFNDRQTHVICLKFPKPTATQPHPELYFFIYDIGKEDILFEDSLINAKVSWISDSQVEAEFIPEIISGEEDTTKSGYIYDVSIMKKLPIEYHQ